MQTTMQPHLMSLRNGLNKEYPVPEYPSRRVTVIRLGGLQLLLHQHPQPGNVQC